LQIRVDGQNRDLGSRKKRALPTLLVVNRRRSVPALADLFDAAETSVRGAIAPDGFGSASLPVVGDSPAALAVDLRATATVVMLRGKYRDRVLPIRPDPKA
jgi:hypothetical protein